MIFHSGDIDMLAKVVDFAKSVSYQNTYTKIVFVDEKKKEYFSEVKNLKISLEKNMIVKLRSVQIKAVKSTYSIEFFNYSEILMLNKDYKDSKEILNKTLNYRTSR